MLGNKEIMAKNIQYYMDKYDKSRNDICNDLGFKYSTFSDWINGKKYPRIDKIEMMANYFHISKSCLVEEQPDPLSSAASTISRVLTPDESSLLDDFQKLNAKGQEKAIEYVADLADNDKYTKNDAGESTIQTA